MAGKWQLGRDFERNNLQVALQQDIRPDILTNHVRYSEKIDTMMPKAKFLTIVRDPVEQFISSFYYYHKTSSVFKSLPRTEQGLLQFLENPQFYQKEWIQNHHPFEANYIRWVSFLVWIWLCKRSVMTRSWNIFLSEFVRFQFSGHVFIHVTNSLFSPDFILLLSRFPHSRPNSE